MPHVLDAIGHTRAARRCVAPIAESQEPRQLRECAQAARAGTDRTRAPSASSSSRDGQRTPPAPRAKAGTGPTHAARAQDPGAAVRVVPKQRRTSVECELFSERFLCSRDTAEIKPRGARPAYSPARRPSKSLAPPQCASALGCRAASASWQHRACKILPGSAAGRGVCRRGVCRRSGRSPRRALSSGRWPACTGRPWRRQCSRPARSRAR